MFRNDISRISTAIGLVTTVHTEIRIKTKVMRPLFYRCELRRATRIRFIHLNTTTRDSIGSDGSTYNIDITDLNSHRRLNELQESYLVGNKSHPVPEMTPKTVFPSSKPRTGN